MSRRFSERVTSRVAPQARTPSTKTEVQRAAVFDAGKLSSFAHLCPIASRTLATLTPCVNAFQGVLCMESLGTEL